MTEHFLDFTGTACPKCYESKTIRYCEIPPSRTTYTKDGEEHTIYNGPSRDYICGNCDAEWTMHRSDGDDSQ